MGSEDFLVLPSSWLVTLYSCLEEGQLQITSLQYYLLCGRLLCRQLVWQNKVLNTQSSLKTTTCAQPAGVPFWLSVLQGADGRLATFLLVSGACWSRPAEACAVPVCKLDVGAVSQLSVEKVLDVSFHLG